MFLHSGCSSDPECSIDLNDDIDPFFHPEAERAESSPAISRPSNPHRHVQWEIGPAPVAKCSTKWKIKLRSNDNSPLFKLHATASQHLSLSSPRSIPSIGITAAKGASLSPQLCDETSNDSRPVMDCPHRLLEALRQSQDPCQDNKDAEFAIRDTLTRYLLGISL